MALMLEYKPGADLTRPWPWALTGRTNPGFQRGSNGVLKPVPATAIRDSHWIGGVRNTLLEPAATNSVLQSQAWATSPWSFNVVTATNNAAAGPDGSPTATNLVPNNTGANNNPYATSGSVAIAADEFLAASCYVKANGYAAVVFRFSDSTSTNGFQASFDLSTGSFGSLHNGFGAGTLTGFTSEALANGWYRVMIWGNCSNSGSGTHPTAAQLFCYVYPNIATANAQTAYTADGTSGVLGWGAQGERNGALAPSPPTSYVPTAAGTATRGGDVISTPWPFQASLWFYMKFIDLGWAVRANFENGPQWTNATSSKPALQVFTGSGTGGATPSHRLNWRPNTGPSSGANQNAAIITPGVNLGDTVELFGRFPPDASVHLSRRVNGGAVTTVDVAATGGVPPAMFASSVLFYMNQAALIGLQVLRVGADPLRITTLALGAAQ